MKSEEIGLNDDTTDILTGVGRTIDEQGGFGIEITPDRTRDDIANNRPGAQLREKILALP